MDKTHKQAEVIWSAPYNGRVTTPSGKRAWLMQICPNQPGYVRIAYSEDLARVRDVKIKNLTPGWVVI